MATADNLKIAQQLLATMQQITAQVERQTQAYHAQAQLVEALCKAQECFGKIDAEKVKEITDALAKAQEKTKEFGKSIEEVGEKQFSKLEKAMLSFAKKLAEISVPEQFLKGFKSGIGLSNNLFKNIMSLGAEALGMLKDIGMFLLSLPGRLIEFFQVGSGGSDPYRQALEDLRKEFGNLDIGTSAAIKNMTESTKGLAQSGLAFSRVFGYGREGMAKLLQENMELFKAMGPLADRLAASIRGSEEEFTLLRKATGFGADAMKHIQLSAEEAGISTATAVNNMTKEIAKAERAFGISAKIYGKDLEFMMKETATFGIMSTTEMLKMSTYARKLGLSIESLKKVVDKAFNFEDAAQQAAKLGEAFGIALDPIQQLQADPVKKMDNIRQAFFKTGQTYESMSAQARKYLADQVGITDEEARIAFSQKNRAMTGAQVDAQMKKAQKTQISQAEAMKQLAKSIERLIQSGDSLKGSFFDVFAQGFNRGIRRSREFREVVHALQRSMRIVYWAGRDVGRMFVKEFPGIKTMLKGLADMFNPRRFRELMDKVKQEFRNFFKMLQTDPKAGVQIFMQNMKKIFFDFFTKGAPAGSRFIDGLKQFWKAVFTIAVEGIRKGLEALRDVLQYILQVATNPQLLREAAGQTGDDIVASFESMWGYVRQELGPVFMQAAEILWDLLKLMVSTLYERYIKPNLGTIILAYFAPAIIGGLIRGAGASLMLGLSAIITRSVQGSNMIAEGMRRTTTVTRPDGTTTTTTMERQAQDFQNKTNSLWRLAGTLAILIVAIAAFVGAVILLAKIYEYSGIKMETFIVVGAMFGGVALLMTLIIRSGLVQALNGLSGVDWKSLGTGLAIMAGIFTAIGLTVAAMVALAKYSPEPAKLEAVGELMVLTTAIFFAAVPLIFAAGAVGAAAATGFGAAAAATGMAALGLVVAEIATVAVVIADKFGRVNVTAAQTAALVMEKITNLYSVIAPMLLGLLEYSELTRNANDVRLIVGGLTGLIHKVGEGAISVLDRLNISGDPVRMRGKTDLIAAVLGGMGSIIGPLANFATAYTENAAIFESGFIEKFGTSISMIIGTLGHSIGLILDKIRNFLHVVRDPNLVKAAGSAIGSILQAIGGLVGGIMQLIPSGGGVTSALTGLAVGAGIGMAFGPAGAAVGAVIGAAVGYVASRAEFSAKIKAMQDIIVLVSDKLQGLVTSIAGPIQAILQLPNISENSIKAAEALGPIFSGVASILSSVMKSADAIKAFEGINRMTPEQARNVITDFKNLIEKVGESVRLLVDTLKTFLVSSVAAIPTTLSENQLKAYDKIGGLITAIGNIIGSVVGGASSMMFNALRSPSTDQRVSAEDVGNLIGRASDFLRQSLTSLPEIFRSIIGTLPQLMEVIKRMPNIPTGYMTKLDAFTKTIDMLKSITDFFTNFVGAARNFDRSGTEIETKILEVKLALLRLLVFFGSSAHGGVPQLIQNLIDKIAEFNFGTGGTKTFLQKITAIKTTFETLSSIVASIKSISGAFPSTTGNTDQTTQKISNGLQTINSVLETVTQDIIETTSSSSSITFILNPLYNTDLHNRFKQLNSLLKSSRLKANIEFVASSINSIYSAAASVNGPSTDNSSTTRSLIANSLSLINTVAGKLTETTDSNPFSGLDKPTNILTRLGNLANQLRSQNIPRKFALLSEQITLVYSSCNSVQELLSTSAGLLRPQAATDNMDQIFGQDGFLARIESYFADEAVPTRINNITRNIRERTLAPIRDMVTAYNDFAAALQNLGAGTQPIQVTLDNLGNRLGAQGRMVVNNAAVQATINVNVTLEVDHVVQALHTHSTQNRNANDRAIAMTAYNNNGNWTTTPG